jgi:hypothetical protein
MPKQPDHAGDQESAGVERRRKWLSLLSSLAILLAVAAIIVVLLVEPGKRLGFSIFMAIIIGLGIIKARYRSVDRAVKKVFAGYFLFLFWVMVTIGPLALFHQLSRFVLAQLSLAPQIIVFVAWGLILTFALGLIATEQRRNHLFEKLRKTGLLAPVAYALNVLVIAVVFFSSITYVLVSRDVLSVTVAPGSTASPGLLADFFLWHFLEAIPILKVNETLKWQPPATYESGWIGMILLLFKLTVIIPATAAFAWTWKRFHQAAPQVGTQNLQKSEQPQ